MPPKNEPVNRSRWWPVAPALISLMLALQGCAGGKATVKAKPGEQTVKVDEGSDLPELGKGLKTQDDSLVLDLLLGYRMLLLSNPDAKALDQDALKRSRKAFERLEYFLRHGGLRAHESGERVYSITSEDRLSLQEVLRSASASAGKSARAGDWERAKVRWREILQSKPAVAWTMEEAAWGLAMAEALESPQISEPIKKKLRDLDESYSREISQDEIARQVKDLLSETIQDDKLRRELKKLANRAWERDKRAGRLTATQPSVGDTAPKPASAAGFAPPQAPESPAAPAAPPAQASPEAIQGMAQIDTLIAQGKYLAALRSLDNTPAADPAWAKERKGLIGDRYCDDKRKSAANGFKDFKKAANDKDRGLHLKRTASDLDSCLFYFPDNPVSQKVRRNREMVETELKKLKP